MANSWLVKLDYYIYLCAYSSTLITIRFTLPCLLRKGNWCWKNRTHIRYQKLHNCCTYSTEKSSVLKLQLQMLSKLERCAIFYPRHHRCAPTSDFHKGIKSVSFLFHSCHYFSLAIPFRFFAFHSQVGTLHVLVTAALSILCVLGF